MSGFFQKVYALVRQIPPGRVASYGMIARMLGRPASARTVGWALRALGEGTDVPWHRVINHQGSISLHPLEGGALQRAMLETEGVDFDVQGRVDWQRFGWRT
ncbi:MAG: methylated-DNA--[protein]-cysteine S-methyltransferase [Chloroflexia bacterium]|nr:methylated-DNA--[protein]-cysteine S-methyltransferase [Chloroflexia bacterium]